MRIELNYGPQQMPETKRADRQPAPNAATSMANQGVAEDQAHISTAHVQAQALAAQAAQLPEIREERVQALRQAVQSGTYRPAAEHVARAVVEQMANKSAA